MAIPAEFTREAIDAAAALDTFAPMGGFPESGEPYRSLLKHNPWMRAPAAQDELEWGKGRYYDTTVARKHPYWRDKNLPAPTKDLATLRRDLHGWGLFLMLVGL